MRKISLYFLWLLFLLSACSTIKKPFYNKDNINWQANSIPGSDQIEHSIFLIGDAGAPSLSTPEPVLSLLQQKLLLAGTNSTVVFLGDNIYHDGLPEQQHPGRIEAEQKLNAQLDILKNYDGKIVFLPGNHDWQRGGKGGLAAVIRQEGYIEQYLNKGNTFLPDDGCPGPVEVHLSDEIVLIILNTQWWFHKWDKPTSDCEIKDKVDFLLQLENVLKNNKGKKIIVAGHHPLFSMGNHAGHFSVKDHIFPLTNIKNYLYVPLPLIGSLYPAYRKFLGNIQDFAHPQYKSLKEGLLALFNNSKDIIYAAGHEHNLQYIKHNQQHYIVSGAGSKTTYTTKRKQAAFAYAHKGFIELNYFKNGEAWMKVWVIDKENPVFIKQLSPPDLPDSNATALPIDYSDSTVTIIAGENYKASAIKRLFLGNHYRDVWLTPLEVPVLDIGNEHGGLTPVKRGGGMQTKSLRLKAPNGEEFVVRSIQKYPAAVLPQNLQHTLAADVIQDQISTAHPYGAFVIAELAEAAEILHKHPRLVFIPNDPLLKKHRKEFGNMLALYEQRATKKLPDYEKFGHSDQAVSTNKLLKLMRKNNGNMVDEFNLAKNRLFDMLVGDWDRHEDQWRWARFRCTRNNHDHCSHINENTQFFLPIPRDRDQVFFKFDGIFPWIASRKWLLRNLQHFDHDIRDIEGMGFNSRFLDRSLLSRLALEDWISIANNLQIRITNKIIEESIRQWPDTIFKLTGEVTIAKLKSRRDKLSEFAKRYYSVLAKEVDITGSDMNEFFDVRRINDEITSVDVYNISNGEKSQVLYHRVFKTHETKEIRLYGLGGEDQFHITGKVNKGILVRIISGDGQDQIKDESSVKGFKKMTKIYGIKTDTKLEMGKESKNLTSRNVKANEYNRKSFQYDMVAPSTFFGYNTDDGLLIGGGIVFRHYAFRKNPYASKQKFIGNYAIRTGSFNFRYEGDFTTRLDQWGFHLNFLVFAPKSITNYYGLGNETEILNPQDINFHLLRFNNVVFHPSLKKSLGNHQTLKVGPAYQYIDVRKTPGRFVSSAESNLTNEDFEHRHFFKLKSDYVFSKVDNKIIPARGIIWKMSGSWNLRLDEGNKNFSQISSEIGVFLPLPLHTTLAVRIGGATIFNDFDFYHANTLGGQSLGGSQGNLRGFRRDRFSGRSSLYWNTELRTKLFNFRTYLFPGQLGILGFVDQGRVWIDNERSDTWHLSYGGGLWISPLGQIVLNATYAISTEEHLFSFNLGFLF